MVSGVLAYVLFALRHPRARREAAAPVSVLWTLWALAGAAFTFPLQHWITRCVTAGRAGDVRGSAGRVAAVVVAAALVAGALAWVFRDRLFHRDDAWFPALVVLVVLGSAAVGVLRGSLGGRGRMGAVAVSLVAENAAAVPPRGRAAAGAGARPGGLRPVPGAGVVGRAVAAAPGVSTRRARVGAGSLAFLGGAATAQLLAQGVLTGGAVVLALIGGSPAEITAVFATLALFRAPYMVVLGTLPQVTHHVTGLVEAGDLRALRLLAGRLAVLGAAVVGCWGPSSGGTAGPALVRAVFGDTVDIGHGDAGVIATGCALALANVVLMVAALALDRPGRVAGAWGLAVLAGAVVLLPTTWLLPVERVAFAFVAAEVAATVLLAVAASSVLRAGRTTA